MSAEPFDTWIQILCEDPLSIRVNPMVLNYVALDPGDGTHLFEAIREMGQVVTDRKLGDPALVRRLAFVLISRSMMGEDAWAEVKDTMPPWEGFDQLVNMMPRPRMSLAAFAAAGQA